MNKAVRILLWIVGILLVTIGYLCYQISMNAFNNYLIFMLSMAFLRLGHALLLIKTQK